MPPERDVKGKFGYKVRRKADIPLLLRPSENPLGVLLIPTTAH